MRTFLLIIPFPVIILLTGYSCRNESRQPNVAKPASLIVQDSVVLISFEKEILPILKSRCSPCHFTGGKMYQKMPFDVSKTITDHPEGILKRLKDEPKIKTFIDQQTKP